MIGLLGAFSGALAAQPVVVTGTGDPNLDVPAVQIAVDQGGTVVLMGRFSFDRPPTAPDAARYNRTVTVSAAGAWHIPFRTMRTRSLTHAFHYEGDTGLIARFT